MKNKTAYFTALEKLLSFESVYSTPEPNAPFGRANRQALDFFLNTAKDLGFETVNYDGYAGEVIFGNGQEIGIIGHLDVVPVGHGWDSPPFTLTKKDGKYFARGISDDKAPLLSCLFALKELKDSGENVGVKFRLIAGCDEESGWRDVEYLKTKTSLPEYGFSPDGNFPLSYAEKGMYEITFTLPKLNKFSQIKGGTVVNAVCDYAQAVQNDQKINLELIKKHGLSVKNGNVIESYGKAAHGSTPHLGKNAIKPLLEYMLDMGENVGNAIEYLFNDQLKVGELENEQGKVTFSPDLVFEKNGETYITCDCRVPAPFSLDTVMKKFNRFNMSVTVKTRHEPVMVQKDGWFVQTLLSAHDCVLGTESTPLSMGGSTFARAFKKGCAFGPSFPNYDNKIHDANENESEENLLTAYEIYKKAIFALAKI